MFSALAIARSSASSSRTSYASLRALSTVSDTLNPRAARSRRHPNLTTIPADSSTPSSLPVSLPIPSTEVSPSSASISVGDAISSPDTQDGEHDNFTFLNKFFLEAARADEDRALDALKYRPHLTVRPTGSLDQSLKSKIICTSRKIKPGQLLVKFPEALGRTPYLKIVANGPLTREYIDHTFAEMSIRTKSVCLLSQRAPDETFDLGQFVFQVALSSTMNLAMAIGIQWPHFEIISAHLDEEHARFTIRKKLKPLDDIRPTRSISSLTHDLYLHDEFEFEKIPAATKLPTTDPMNSLPVGSHGCHIKIISNQHLDYDYLRTLFLQTRPPIPIYTMWNLPSAEPSVLCFKKRYFCMVQLGSMKDLYRALKLDLPSCKIISIHFDEKESPTPIEDERRNKVARESRN